MVSTQDVADMFAYFGSIKAAPAAKDIRSSGTSDRRRRFEEKEMHKKLLSALCGLAAAFASAALAQDSYPKPRGAHAGAQCSGSSIDTMSRIVAAKLGDALGQSVFVETVTAPEA